MGLFDLFSRKKDKINYEAFALILYNNYYLSTQDDKISLIPNPSWFKELEYLREWYNTLTDIEKRSLQHACHSLAIFITLAACRTSIANGEKYNKVRVYFLNLFKDEFGRVGLSSEYQFLMRILDRA